jgi:hypothetical protein
MVSHEHAQKSRWNGDKWLNCPKRSRHYFTYGGRVKEVDRSVHSLCMVYQVQYNNIKQSKIRKSGTLFEGSMLHLWSVEHVPMGTPSWKRKQEIKPESDCLSISESLIGASDHHSSNAGRNVLKQLAEVTFSDIGAITFLIPAILSLYRTLST